MRQSRHVSSLRWMLRPKARLAYSREYARRALGRPPGRSAWLKDRPVDWQRRVHVGAGGVSLPGWTNTDVDGTADYFLDATAPWPLPESSLSHVYADNVIEHLQLPAARSFLLNARKALRPRGIIRLVTPDVRTSAEAYVSGGTELDAIVDRHARHGYNVSYPVDILRILFAESGHHAGYLFDEDCLRQELELAGFVRINRCAPGESDDPALMGLDARDEGIDGSIFMSLEGEAP